jgi:exopolysaccharide biosynthesis WecB/TagA/CpsF family protein
MDQSIVILGVNVAVCTFGQAVEKLEWFIGDGRSSTVFFANAHTLNLAHKDRGYKAILNTADLVLEDGFGAALAARILGQPIDNLGGGTELVPYLFRRAQSRGYRFYLLGGKPGVAQRAAANLLRRYPGLCIVGTRHGYVKDEETQQLIVEINRTSPDVLLVGMGNPLQERWLSQNKDRLCVPLSLGVGGLFDIFSGELKKIPRWLWRIIRMEWMFIVLMQPHKWRRYFVGIPIFLVRVIKQRFAVPDSIPDGSELEPA